LATIFKVDSLLRVPVIKPLSRPLACSRDGQRRSNRSSPMTPRLRSCLTLLGTLAIGMAWALSAHAQNYPDRPSPRRAVAPGG
jgi:hypothetical protein